MTPDNAVTPPSRARTEWAPCHPPCSCDPPWACVPPVNEMLVKLLDIEAWAIGISGLARDARVQLAALVDALTAAAPRVGHDRPRDEDALVPGLLEPAAAGDRDTPGAGAHGQEPQDPCPCDGIGPWLGADSRSWHCENGHTWSGGVRVL